MTPKEFENRVRLLRGLTLAGCAKHGQDFAADAELTRQEIVGEYGRLRAIVELSERTEPFRRGLEEAVARHMQANRRCGCSVCTYVHTRAEAPPDWALGEMCDEDYRRQLEHDAEDEQVTE